MIHRALSVVLAAALAACASSAPSLIQDVNPRHARFTAGEGDVALVIAGVLIDRPEGESKVDATVIWRRVDDASGEFGVFRRNKSDEILARTSETLFRTLDDRAAWSLHRVRPGTYALDGGEVSRGGVGARAVADLRDGKRLAFDAAAGEIVFIGLARVPVTPDPSVSLARLSAEDFQDVVAELRRAAPRVVGDPQPARFALKAVPCREQYQPLAFHQHCVSALRSWPK